MTTLIIVIMVVLGVIIIGGVASVRTLREARSRLPTRPDPSAVRARCAAGDSRRGATGACRSSRGVADHPLHRR
jgi:hypothetical protein